MRSNWLAANLPPPTLIPWEQVKKSWDAIDPTVFRTSMEYAKDEFASGGSTCPQCERGPSELFWISVSTPDETWQAGNGQAGFLTICEECLLQVDFFVDPFLTEIEAEAREMGE